MRKEEIASWDGGKSTWGGRVRVFGTVPVSLGAQEIAWGRGEFLAGKGVVVLCRLVKSKEQIEEEENRALESINETPAQKAAKRRGLNEEDKDVEEI
nr:hypothetical protein [Tanacetum cinerariifolium]